MNKYVFENTTALVTGASSGIGEAFARELAQRGADLILVARSEKKLSKLADDLKGKYRSSIHIFPMDLVLPGAPQQLFDSIMTNGLSVHLLVNNAGFGKWAHFLGESMETYEGMMSLNISALVKLTYLCVPEMLTRGGGGVINVASTAAFQPVPYQAVYAASKAFVLSFTEALAGEYRERNVRCLALCPGNTSTNFMAIANANAEGMAFATSEAVAKTGLNAFTEGKSYHVHGRVNYLHSLIPRFLPRAAVIRIVADMFKNRVTPYSA